jgi:hypothetical protein
MAKVELGRRAAGLRWDVRGCFALAVISSSLRLEVLISVATLHEFARLSIYIRLTMISQHSSEALRL